MFPLNCLLIVSADAIRMSADTIRLSADNLIQYRTIRGFIYKFGGRATLTDVRNLSELTYPIVHHDC